MTLSMIFGSISTRTHQKTLILLLFQLGLICHFCTAHKWVIISTWQNFVVIRSVMKKKTTSWCYNAMGVMRNKMILNRFCEISPSDKNNERNEILLEVQFIRKNCLHTISQTQTRDNKPPCKYCFQILGTCNFCFESCSKVCPIVWKDSLFFQKFLEHLMIV